MFSNDNHLHVVGKNLHEIITSEGLDSSKSERFTVDEIMEVI